MMMKLFPHAASAVLKAYTLPLGLVLALSGAATIFAVQDAETVQLVLGVSAAPAPAGNPPEDS